jgi:hypothetical protein
LPTTCSRRKISPSNIEVYARHLRRLEVLAAAATSLSRIADILRNKTGNVFHGYKQNTFTRTCPSPARWDNQWRRRE